MQTQYFTCPPVPQAAYAPVQYPITLPWQCTPVWGQGAEAQAAPPPPTRIGCGTIATVCNPTHMHCTGGGVAQQAAAPPPTQIGCGTFATV